MPGVCQPPPRRGWVPVPGDEPHYIGFMQWCRTHRKQLIFRAFCRLRAVKRARLAWFCSHPFSRMKPRVRPGWGQPTQCSPSCCSTVRPRRDTPSPGGPPPTSLQLNTEDRLMGKRGSLTLSVLHAWRDAGILILSRRDEGGSRSVSREKRALGGPPPVASRATKPSSPGVFIATGKTNREDSMRVAISARVNATGLGCACDSAVKATVRIYSREGD